MKKTKIFLMSALALTFAACSNDDNVIQTSDKPAKAEGIPFSASISIDNGAATRALTETETTLEASWAVGEKVALIHNGVSDEMEVESVSEGVATITGTITGSPADGDAVTVIYPSTAADGTTGDVKADLLYAQDGTLATIASSYDACKGSGTLKVSGTASLDGSVSLTNQFAIFKFTVKNSDASATIDVKPLTITIGTQDYIITPATATSTLYAALPAVSSQTVSFSATGSDNKTYSCSKDDVTIAAGNYYQTTLKMAANPYATAKLGDLFYSDGTFSTTLETGKTPIGVIAYLGTDAFSENGTTVNGSTFAGHGLVLCLKNAASGADAQWSTEYSTLEFGEDAKVEDVEGLKRTTNVSGYTNTKTLAEKDGAATKYKAAYAAKNYTGLTAPTGTTDWFLPSAQQWVKMIEGLGELAESDIKWDQWFDNSHTVADKWEAALSKAGSGNYDSMTSYLWYWSSSECSAERAPSLNIDATDTGESYGILWYYDRKDGTDELFRVRPVLAF